MNINAVPPLVHPEFLNVFIIFHLIYVFNICIAFHAFILNTLPVVMKHGCYATSDVSKVLGYINENEKKRNVSKD